jgi:hypothetical protein
MSHFKTNVTNRIVFDNGYSVRFDEATSLGSVFCMILLKADNVLVSDFLSNPGKGDGYSSFLTPEDFAEVLYRVSKEAKKE